MDLRLHSARVSSSPLSLSSLCLNRKTVDLFGGFGLPEAEREGDVRRAEEESSVEPCSDFIASPV